MALIRWDGRMRLLSKVWSGSRQAWRWLGKYRQLWLAVAAAALAVLGVLSAVYGPLGDYARGPDDGMTG
jgi:hypothetical protein